MKKIVLTISFITTLFAQNIEDTVLNDKNQLLRDVSAELFKEFMKVKRNFSDFQILAREELLSNLSSTAPRLEFIVNADIETSLAEGIISSSLFVSTNGQSSWESTNNLSFLGTYGYEDTWEGLVNTNGGNSSNWYISALINSEVLEQNFGNITVSQSPLNNFNNWPPGNSLYALLGSDISGDAPSSQDITSIKGTFSNYNDNLDRLYLGMTLSASCCDEGGFFGPWYLYGLGILNPDSESGVAYAVGYGDGGLGQLTPGILKLSGDLASGNISGFEYLTEDIDYSTAGSQLQTNLIMDYIINDSDWGTWPNSTNGIIILGVTVKAELDGTDVAIAILDQTDPSLFILSSQEQEGNSSPVLSNFLFDSSTNTVSIQYSDIDGNLPWKHTVSICETDSNICNDEIGLIPNSHTYFEGTLFTKQLNISDINPGSYYLQASFNDSDAQDQILILDDFITFYGCDDQAACNYTLNVTGCEDGNNICCDYPEINYDCFGNCIDSIDCFGVCGGNALVDECGVCNGNNECDCPEYPDETIPDCLGICGGTANYDECGVCNGEGIPPNNCDCDGHVLDECGICGGQGIPASECDCNGNIIDCEGICGGYSEFDECGICLGQNECLGCIDTFALNYDAGATINDNSCEYNQPSGLIAVYDDENETVYLEWETAIIEPEEPCPNEGEILDCNGTCAPADWIGDGYCDDGSFYYSTTYGYCGSDPTNLPSDDCVSIVLNCDELNNDNNDCELDCPPEYTLDCNGTCVPLTWIGDGYCDVGQWGGFLYCELGDWDGGDCGSCGNSSEVQDCNGDCWPYSVIGDGWCDDDIFGADIFNWEEDFDCSEFGYDGGDCIYQRANNTNQTTFQRIIKQLPILGIKNYIVSAPSYRDDIAYRIDRNQVEIAETQELFYLDTSPVNYQNCYTITALFPYGSSNPTSQVCIDADIELIAGDINNDGIFNVQDIILLVDIVLNNGYNEIADLNGDDIVNVLDIIQLVNIILDS